MWNVGTPGTRNTVRSTVRYHHIWKAWYYVHYRSTHHVVLCCVYSRDISDFYKAVIRVGTKEPARVVVVTLCRPVSGLVLLLDA